MIVWLIGAALCFSAGVWLFVSAVWPAAPSLEAALEHLHEPAAPSTVGVPSTAPDRSVTVRVGSWLLRRTRGGGLSDDQTLRDLEVLHRPLEVHAGTSVLATLAGGLLGPLAWSVLLAAGTSLPVIVPVWFAVLGAVVGYVMPRLVLRAEAAQARSDFRHALGAYLDILVLLLAANEGPEGAMETAARSGSGRAFMDLRRATLEARLSLDAVWARLDDLGLRIGVEELREIAAAGSLAGEQGAAVRTSLMAKARALRASSLSAQESTARRRSQAMFAPILMMGVGFLLFLLYPLVSNIEFG